MRNEDMYHYSFDIDAMERELQQIIIDNEQWQHYSTSQRSSAS